jgi:serine/threonine protein kinase
MPPENVPDPYSVEPSSPQFTRKGDVWAFGVVLFEIWTNGKLPYEKHEDARVKCIERGQYYTLLLLTN